MKKNNSNTKKEERDIRLVFAVFSILFGLIAWKNLPSVLSNVLIGIISFFLIAITFKPLLLRPAFNVWLKIAHFIGRVNTQIIMTLFYYIILTPFGVIMRIFGRDPMQRKIGVVGTYWEPYNVEGLKDKSRYEKQF